AVDGIVDGQAGVAQACLAFDTEECVTDGNVIAGEDAANDAIAAQAIVSVTCYENVLGLNFVVVEPKLHTHIRSGERRSHSGSGDHCGGGGSGDEGNIELHCHSYS